MLTTSEHQSALSELIVVADTILRAHNRLVLKLPQSGGQLCDNCLAKKQEIKQDKVGR